MKDFQEKHIKRRLRTSSLSTILSISLVLLMLGSMGFIFVNSQKITKYIKENVGITIVLNNENIAVDVLQFQKNLDANEWIKSTIYVSKEDAAKELVSELGEDFVSFLGFNPLSNTIDVFMKSEYANSQTMEQLAEIVKKNELVKDVVFQNDLIDAINNNIENIKILGKIFVNLS